MAPNRKRRIQKSSSSASSSMKSEGESRICDSISCPGKNGCHFGFAYPLPLGGIYSETSGAKSACLLIWPGGKDGDSEATGENVTPPSRK